MLDDLDKGTKKVLLGALIGSALGLTTSLVISSGNRKKGLSGGSISKIVGQLGEVIESTKEGKSILKKAEREVHGQENLLLSAIDLAAAGIEFWKKLKKAA